MGRLLSPRRRLAGIAALLPALLASAAAAAPGIDAGSGRHAWSVEAAFAVPTTDTPLAAWTERGQGKLRTVDDGPYVNRLVAEYRGRLTPTLDARVVADYVDDASPGLDLTEAFVEWRPVPTSALRHEWRFGGFHPKLSLENVASAWASPFSMSYSAINTWLGEEVRNFGAEWQGRRGLGGPGARQEVGLLGGLFYGNDPAGTLLYWRGWSLHDRQTRFGDRFELMAQLRVDAAGHIVGLEPLELEPFAEIDERPGFYAGAEWRLKRRALVRATRYDNRASALDYEAGQWAWDTSFDQISLQLELPLGLGLVAERLRGRTIWLVGGLADGTRPAGSRVVEDEFAADFVMLTKRLGERHRLTLRRDEFDIERAPGSAPAGLEVDSGRAWTASYRYRFSDRLRMTVEWLEIESSRALWPALHALPREAEERQLNLRFEISASGSSDR